MGRVQNGQEGPNPGPIAVENLVTLQLADTTASGNAYVSVYEESAYRGGVIGGGDPFATNLPQEDVEIMFDCFPQDGEGGVAAYDYWVYFGKPQCWCDPYQCDGDANNKAEGSKYTGYYYVGVNDLTILANGWGIKEPLKGPGIGVPEVCADFDHGREGSKYTGYYHVGVNDLTILANWWGVKEPLKGPGLPGNCPR